MRDVFRCYSIVLLLICAGINACTPAIEAENLYGTWDYIQVEHPANPADDLNSQQLAIMQPSVTFTRQNGFEIIWDGRRLSAGKYRIDKNMIRITEDLGGGKTREFPFFVSKLTADELIFETLGEEGSKVTAVKHK